MCFEMAHNTRRRKRRVLGVLTFGTLHYDSQTAEAKPSDPKPYRAVIPLDFRGSRDAISITLRESLTDADTLSMSPAVPDVFPVRRYDPL